MTSPFSAGSDQDLVSSTTYCIFCRREAARMTTPRMVKGKRQETGATPTFPPEFTLRNRSDARGLIRA